MQNNPSPETENRHLTSAERQKLYEEKATARRIERLKKKRRAKYIRIALIAAAVLILIGAMIGLILVNKYVWTPAKIYEEANSLYAAQDYLRAYEVYLSLGDYKDAAAIASTCITKNAQKLAGREDVIMGTSESMPWFKIDENGAIRFEKKKFKGADELIIPDVFDNRLVIAIADNGFSHLDQFTSIVIPPSVKRIEELGFFSCGGLTEIVLPEYIEYIGDKAFEECESLTSVTLSKNLKELGTAAFRNCNALTEIVFPEGFEILGANALASCEKLTSVSFPSTLTKIGNKSFDGCEGLAYISYNGTKEAFELLCSGYGNDTILKVKEIKYSK